MTATTTNLTSYVTVMPSSRKSGWLAAERIGDVITHHSIMVNKLDADAARAKAETMFPDKRVYLAGDPNPPWKETS